MQAVTDSTPLPWSQHPGETAVAYQAFTRYRDMGAARSCAKVGQELGKSRTLINRWSSRWNWTSRAAAWDAEVDREWRAELADQHRDVRRRLLRLSGAALSIWTQRLANLDPSEIKAADMARWLQSVSAVQLQVIGEPEPPTAARSPMGQFVSELIKQTMEARGMTRHGG